MTTAPLPQDPYETPDELLLERARLRANLARLKQQASDPCSHAVKLTRSSVKTKPPTDKLIRFQTKVEERVKRYDEPLSDPASSQLINGGDAG